VLLGASFGYHRALDSAGAVGGGFAAVALLAAGASLRTIVWIAVVPAALAFLLFRRLHEAPARTPLERDGRSERLPREFWLVLAVWVVFSLGNSSDTFLLLRAKDLGLGFTLVVLAYALFNVVYSGLSWPLGALSDRVPRAAVLACGLAVFALVYLGFAVAPGSWAIWPLFVVYGIYVAATEGVAKAWVGDHAPAGAGGTAFGIFSAATGAALLVASVVGGVLWSTVGPSAPFYLGSACSVAALALLASVSSYEPLRRSANRTAA
jgi:MFS family permease